MIYEKVVAVFNSPAHAEAAVSALKAGGFGSGDIAMCRDNALFQSNESAAFRMEQALFWRDLFGCDIRGSEWPGDGSCGKDCVTVSAKIPETEVLRAIAILEKQGPAILRERAVSYETGGDTASLEGGRQDAEPPVKSLPEGSKLPVASTSR